MKEALLKLIEATNAADRQSLHIYQSGVQPKPGYSCGPSLYFGYGYFDRDKCIYTPPGEFAHFAGEIIPWEEAVDKFVKAIGAK